MTVRVSAFHATRCSVAPKREEIGYETEANGSGTRGVALIDASIDAVAVDTARTAVLTVPVPGVPEMSAALVEIPAPFPARSHWFDEFGLVGNSPKPGLERAQARLLGRPTRQWLAGA